MAKPWVPAIPPAPRSIQKGSTLKDLLDTQAVQYLANNLYWVDSTFPKGRFIASAQKDLGPLGIIERGHHIAKAMRQHLPSPYSHAVEVLLQSLTPPLPLTSELGLAVFFYLPHICFVMNYGSDKKDNQGRDPFAISMRAQYELTQRFSAEFSIRRFLIDHTERTLKQLSKWTTDPSPHVRRLCSEGTRPRLPWAMRLPMFMEDPSPVIPILEKLKDDPDLYVRRSVANHVGDIAKDNPEVAFELCERWLKSASTERRWVIRHALRHPAKKNNPRALKLRQAAR